MTLIRLIVSGACLLVLALVAIIGLIHAQPYDDSQLLAFLAPPEGCPLPCFIGIRPGVTTVDEAVAILKTHQWVEQPRVLEATNGRGVYAITAGWSGVQPDLIDAREELWMGVEDEIIQRIVVSTDIRLGDIWLSLGLPHYGLIFEDAVGGRPFVGYIGAYLDIGSSFSTGQRCPLESIWKLQTLWIIGNGLSALDSASADTLPNQVSTTCRRLLNVQ